MPTRPPSRSSPPAPPADADHDPLDSSADDDSGERDVRDHRDERDDSRSVRDFDVRIPLERILPELIRKGFEVGRGPLEKVSESLFSKDIAAQVASHIGDVRSGIVKAVAHEVGRFLREADIANELRKVLTGMDIEAQVRLRFSTREDGQLKVDIDTGEKRKKQRDEK